MMTNPLPELLAGAMYILKQIVREEVDKYAAGGRGANVLLIAILAYEGDTAAMASISMSSPGIANACTPSTVLAGGLFPMATNCPSTST